MGGDSYDPVEWGVNQVTGAIEALTSVIDDLANRVPSDREAWIAFASAVVTAQAGRAVANLRADRVAESADALLEQYKLRFAKVSK